MPRRVRSTSSPYHAGAARGGPKAAAARKAPAAKPTPRQPLAGEPQATAKLFANGRSQAVRLPKEFRMPGSEVRIHREGDRIVLEPLSDVPRDAHGWPLDFWDTMQRLAAGLDPADFRMPDDAVPPPVTPLDQR